MAANFRVYNHLQPWRASLPRERAGVRAPPAARSKAAGQACRRLPPGEFDSAILTNSDDAEPHLYCDQD
jgi:hypothetical protein